jgi:tetratricopeptide (TPR) repeat protein
MEAREKKIQRQMELVSQKKVEEERMVFQMHMALEEKERQRLDDKKAAEKKTAEDSVHDAFTNLRNEKSGHGKSLVVVDGDLNTKKPVGDDDARQTPQDSSVIEHGLDKNQTNVEIQPPPPRKVVVTSFSHTPRLFKTPSRESTIKTEQEFIMKNINAKMKKNALLNADNIDDVDPVWLTSKGTEFVLKGDYCSAINAFTEALVADNASLSALDGRSECYLHQHDVERCVNDCLMALQIIDSNDHRRVDNPTIQPPPPLDQESQLFRKKIHIRLAMANCLLEEYAKAFEHLSAARDMDKNDDDILDGICDLDTYMQANDWKVKADGSFTDGRQLDTALEQYSTAISMDPMHTKARMNRAACYLAMKNYVECIADCDHALIQLQQYQPQQCLMSTPKCTRLIDVMLSPPPNVRRKWIITLLCRRAAAKEEHGDQYYIDGALTDLEEAKSILLRPSIDDTGIDIATIEASIMRLKEGTMMNM